MRAIGLDLGSRTLGVAISDTMGMLASPIGTYKLEENNLQMALSYVKMLIEEQPIQTIVLGLPKNMDGSVGFQGQYTLQFKEMLEGEFDQPVVLIDERLTSKMANQGMIRADYSRKKRKTKVDTIAASIILQSYLDSIKK